MSQLTADFIEILRAGELPVGRVTAVVVGERKLAVYHTANGFFASDNVCPHRGGPLAEGDLIKDEIVCPWHLWGFDVQTGACPGNPEIRIVTHEVRVDEDRLFVKLSPAPPEAL
jgi:nitrite reductase (NADH) small subunit